MAIDCYHYIYFRLLLAALHFNENVNKAQAVTAEGVPRWKLSYPKYKKGKEVVTKVTTKVTYGKYILHNLLFQYFICKIWNNNMLSLIIFFLFFFNHYENLPMQYTVISKVVKNEKF